MRLISSKTRTINSVHVTAHCRYIVYSQSLDLLYSAGPSPCRNHRHAISHNVMHEPAEPSCPTTHDSSEDNLCQQKQSPQAHSRLSKKHVHRQLTANHNMTCFRCTYCMCWDLPEISIDTVQPLHSMQAPTSALVLHAEQHNHELHRNLHMLVHATTTSSHEDSTITTVEQFCDISD